MHFQNKINVYNFCFWKEGMFAEKPVGFTLCMYKYLVLLIDVLFQINHSLIKFNY